MSTVPTVIQSIHIKGATRRWTGQRGRTSAGASRHVWSWGGGGFEEELSTIL